ncbi:molybdopterin molybdotransferase MoeA [Hyphomonas sp. WL0036]|uniref:molybdopterin molybdotransferase MoeA n=1 Tax=Hyphomonas sediminis TaxID=2866160 RepID=UPI001C8274C2|nr:molybdopterin molybdotransferase MoeA [Hyphomonas sediminis]MBY9067427.1 molybdopterin molybdotransferase MoeA [Hyphomonas sediminis]
MISFNEALSRVIGVALPLGSESVSFEAASGRVLSEAVTARFAMPRTDVSAMDGYAVREADLKDIPFSLIIAGEAAAGTLPGQRLPERTAFRIFTGAPVPDGADRVIVQENAERAGDRVTFLRPHGPGRNIRAAGSDFAAGDLLVPAGIRLDWRALTTAAAADQGRISVWRQPCVVILATGDELAAPGQAMERPGAIPESVSPGIAAFVTAHGGCLLRSERLPDVPELLGAAAARALQEADLIIMIGGASVGDRDYSRSVFGEAPDYVFPKVAIKPGKPVWLARIGTRLVLGLPGNPTSALVTARLLLAPLLTGMSGGDAATAVVFEQGCCADPLPACGDRETFLRARMTERGLVLADSQDSGSQRSLAASDALIRRLPGAPAEPAGAPVSYIRF